MSSQAIHFSVSSIKDADSQPADIAQLLFGRALSYFDDLPDPRQRGKGGVSARRGACVGAARGAARGRDLCRYRPVRGEEARAVAPFPAVSRWDAFARSPG